MVSRLLDSGADVNVQGGRYGTALQAASAGGDIDIVRLLLDSGADVNAWGEDMTRHFRRHRRAAMELWLSSYRKGVL